MISDWYLCRFKRSVKSLYSNINSVWILWLSFSLPNTDLVLGYLDRRIIVNFTSIWHEIRLWRALYLIILRHYKNITLYFMGFPAKLAMWKSMPVSLPKWFSLLKFSFFSQMHMSVYPKCSLDDSQEFGNHMTFLLSSHRGSHCCTFYHMLEELHFCPAPGDTAALYIII